MGNAYPCTPIGVIQSPFKERFGIPRQAGLVPAARGALLFQPPYDRAELCEGLEGFSHLWLLFLLHATAGQGWQPRVRPPRLGGNRRVGVFASRSPFRPNPLGLSVVELLGVEPGRLRLGGLDLLDGTPVLDVKPYLPYSDALPDARSGFAPEAPEARLEVQFAPEVAALLESDPAAGGMRALIRQVLALDPRPAYHRAQRSGRTYGMRLGDWELRWRVRGGVVEVTGMRPAGGS